MRHAYTLKSPFGALLIITQNSDSLPDYNATWPEEVIIAIDLYKADAVTPLGDLRLADVSWRKTTFSGEEKLLHALTSLDASALPYYAHGSDFQRCVWQALEKIPHGETRTYSDIAVAIGKPKAYRAVANACGANPIPLLIPCHRVIRQDGSLGGYNLGIELKKKLLKLESKKNQSLIKKQLIIKKYS